jgi:hypothetical protein
MKARSFRSHYTLRLLSSGITTSTETDYLDRERFRDEFESGALHVFAHRRNTNIVRTFS